MAEGRQIFSATLATFAPSALKAVPQQRVPLMATHPGSTAGAAGDSAVNAKGSKVAEKDWGDLRSPGGGFDGRDSSSTIGWAVPAS
ncbi:MAG: hypothetical protein ACJ8AI_19390 [Rhodopila sp.]